MFGYEEELTEQIENLKEDLKNQEIYILEELLKDIKPFDQGFAFMYIEEKISYLKSKQ
jgi:hypothetical protein